MTSADWFSAVTLFESVVADDHDNLFEMRVIVVRAENEAEALAKAEGRARGAGQTYVNAEGNTIEWRFRDVLAIKQLYLDTIGDGDEVFSEFLRKDEAKELRRILTSRL